MVLKVPDIPEPNVIEKTGLRGVLLLML